MTWPTQGSLEGNFTSKCSWFALFHGVVLDESSWNQKASLYVVFSSACYCEIEVAIHFHDLGYLLHKIQQLIKLPTPVTFALGEIVKITIYRMIQLTVEWGTSSTLMRIEEDNLFLFVPQSKVNGLWKRYRQTMVNASFRSLLCHFDFFSNFISLIEN